MLRTIDHKIEGWLYQRGYLNPDVRRLVCNQSYILVGSSGLALVLGQGQGWGIDFTLGAILVTLNFFFLAHFAADIFQRRTRPLLALLLGFYLRLALLAIALFVLIVLAQASVPALLFGLSTVVVNVLFWGATKVLASRRLRRRS
jgi:hypothetical protein